MQEELEGLTPARPEITPPQAKSDTKEPVSGENITITATIEEISSKSGEKNKKPWTLHGVKADGQWYNTFDKKIADEAQEALHHKVDLTYIQTEKSKNLVKITMLTQEDPECTKDPANCDRSTYDDKDKAFCDFEPLADEAAKPCKFQKGEQGEF